MLRKLYDWTLSLASRKSAEVWLAVIAFVESSVFLVPADVLFLPMALARPERAYRFALIATVASTLGGIAGYLLGAYAYELLAKPVLEFYGKLDDFEHLRQCTGNETVALLLVTSGLAHLPPIKIVTILAGVIGASFPFFLASCILARGARKVMTAVLLEKPGHLAAAIAADFCGFTCPDKFVVGYGMDMAHQFRELPFVGHIVSGT